MSWPKLERVRRWIGPAALLAVVPKCAFCVLAYSGLATALGLGGPELCGARSDASGNLAGWLIPSALAASWVGLRAGLESRPPAPAPVTIRSIPKKIPRL